MLEFNKIINPKTNRKVNIDSKLGQSILRSELEELNKLNERNEINELNELNELRKIAKRAEARKN